MLNWQTTRRIILLVSCFLCVAAEHHRHRNSRSRKKAVKYRPTCLKKSEEFGCLQCRSRMFMLMDIDTSGRQKAFCVHTCPNGFFKHREKLSGFNKCQECKISNCRRCFVRGYCTRCEPGYFLNEGKCVQRCPDGLNQNDYARKCEKEIDCKISTWSSWSACVPRKSRCKYGRQTRVRKVLQRPTEGGKKCPKKKKQRAKCKMPKANCPPSWLFKRKKHRKRRTKTEQILTNNTAIFGKLNSFANSTKT